MGDIMIYIWRGQSPRGISALLNEISAIETPEWDPAVAEEKGRVASVSRDEDGLETRRDTAKAGNVVRLGPGLPANLMSLLPDGMSFGNGITTGAGIRLSDGRFFTLSWAVFPDSAAANIDANRAELDAAMV